MNIMMYKYYLFNKVGGSRNGDIHQRPYLSQGTYSEQS